MSYEGTMQKIGVLFGITILTALVTVSLGASGKPWGNGPSHGNWILGWPHHLTGDGIYEAKKSSTGSDLLRLV